MKLDLTRSRRVAMSLEAWIDGAAESCAIDGESPEDLAILGLNLLSPENKATVTRLMREEFEAGLAEGRTRQAQGEPDDPITNSHPAH